MSLRQFSRAFVVTALAIAALFVLSPAAHADAEAEDFMRSILVEANSVFEAESEQARLNGIAALVDKYVDMRRVGMFVLGQYARRITTEQRAEYLPLFDEYATRVYQDTLSDYSGERLEVVRSIDLDPRNIVVETQIVDAAPGSALADVIVHWRIYRTREGALSVVDAGANGVWLAIEQQSQFKSVIANNGGGAAGIDALIADLRTKLAD